MHPHQGRSASARSSRPDAGDDPDKPTPPDALDATASLPLSPSFDNLLPVTASIPDSPSSTEPPKRRPLPTPPSNHSSAVSRISDIIPSSPPPPYSVFLPDDPHNPMSRATHDPPAPEAPVIMPPLPVEQGTQGRAPFDSFLCHSPPPNTWIAVETSQSEYILLVRLPGFRRDGITIATRRRRILHVVADSWEPEGGHFERRVSFGHDAELAQVRAEFDGEMLRITVPRRMSIVSS